MLYIIVQKLLYQILLTQLLKLTKSIKMKKILLASISLALTIGFYACQKSSDVSSNPATTNGLTAAKVSGIESGEPVAFNLTTNSSNTSAISWKVTPAVGVFKAISGNKATFKFTIAGKYNITVTNGLVIDSTLISVDSIPFTGVDTVHYLPIDSAFYPPYIPPPGDTIHYGYRDTTVSCFTNDQIHITPSFIDSNGVTSSVTTAGLLLKASTTKQYPSSAATLVSTIGYDSSNNGNGFGIDYEGVLLPYGTTSAGISSVATVSNFLYMWQDGKYTLRIVYNNVTYTGSVNKVGNTYTFTWPYSSGVVISPLVLTK